MKKIIGIMTGNSLDACDVVLTAFDGKYIKDLASCSIPSSRHLRENILKLRRLLNAVEEQNKDLWKSSFFINTHNEYIHWVAGAVLQLLSLSSIPLSEIDAVAFHGQTLDHCPPSILKDKKVYAYTVQMGSGQMLSDLIGRPVIYDFRSDDIIAGGEGAPLAPVHNENLAQSLGLDNAIFYNAGNTSNLAVIYNQKAVQGFDAGPFNEFNDKLVRSFKNEVYDENGKYGLQGMLMPDLLKELFYRSAITADGSNYYECQPTKSSDPKWYRFDKIEAFQNPEPFNDVLHTAEYFAGYTAAYALRYVLPEIEMPSCFVLFGGGWYNPVAFSAFKKLLVGEGFVLPEHRDIFKQIASRFNGKEPQIDISTLGKFMEARIFADLGRFYLEGRTWTTPSLTGCRAPVVLGRISYPKANRTHYNDYLNRACNGWWNKTSLD